MEIDKFLQEFDKASDEDKKKVCGYLYSQVQEYETDLTTLNSLVKDLMNALEIKDFNNVSQKHLFKTMSKLMLSSQMGGQGVAEKFSFLNQALPLFEKYKNFGE